MGNEISKLLGRGKMPVHLCKPEPIELVYQSQPLERLDFRGEFSARICDFQSGKIPGNSRTRKHVTSQPCKSTFVGNSAVDIEPDG
jgi:hypothetical protein